MMGLSLSRRARLGLIAIFLIALIVLFPMRLMFGIIGAERFVAARSMGGSLWDGHVGQMMLGEVPLGTVDAGLSPVQLLLLRARVDIERKPGLPNPIKGALTTGFGRAGIDSVTGTLPLGAAASPLPLASIDMTDVTVHFAGSRCDVAQGQVRAHVAGQIGGLNLSQGLSGAAQCDGDAMLLPLVSQSGLERLDVRLSGSGRYTAQMRVTTNDETLALGLASAGFKRSGDSLLLTIQGTM